MTEEERLQRLVAVTALRIATATNQVSEATARMIQAEWRQVNPYSASEVRAFARKVGQLVVASQRTVATAHTAAQQVQLQAMGINQPVTVTIPENVRGATVDFSGKTPKVHAPAKTEIDYGDGAETVKRSESTPGRLFERVAEKYRYEKSIGKTDEAANTAAEDRIASLVDDNMILSARMAAQQTLKLVSDEDARVLGYRRIIHPELAKGGVCGMCIVAADRKYKIGDLQPIHTRCNCTVSPIVKIDGVYIDPGHTLNQDDLGRLYVHARETAPTEKIYSRDGKTVIGERKALSTSAKALKKTRYQIVQHNELGPVLTKITGEEVPYYSLTPPTEAA